MLPAEVLKTVLEHLSRKDLEALQLTSRFIRDYVDTHLSKSLDRRLCVTILSCYKVRITLLNDDEGNEEILYAKMTELEQYVGRAIIDLLEFHVTVCPLILANLLALKERLRIVSIDLPAYYSSKEVATLCFDDLFHCNKLSAPQPDPITLRWLALFSCSSVGKTINGHGIDVFGSASMAAAIHLTLNVDFLPVAKLDKAIPWLLSGGPTKRYFEWTAHTQPLALPKPLTEFVDKVLEQFITAKSPAPYHLRLQATVLMHLSADMERSETLRNEEASEELFYIADAKAVPNAMHHYFTIEIKRKFEK